MGECLNVPLVIIGDTSVGKSSILVRFCEDRFESNYVITIGVEYQERTIQINDTRMRLKIWDTAGQERFRSVTPAYYRRALGVLVIFDLTNRKSFENVEDWLRSLQAQGDPTVQKILVGNKVDLSNRRQVSKEEGDNLAKKHQMKYFEVSAKTAVNVEDVFFDLATQVKINHKLIPANNSNSHKSNNPQSKITTKCC
jgi:small GTP-binding protein